MFFFGGGIVGANLHVVVIGSSRTSERYTSSAAHTTGRLMSRSLKAYLTSSIICGHPQGARIVYMWSHCHSFMLFLARGRFDVLLIPPFLRTQFCGLLLTPT